MAETVINGKWHWFDIQNDLATQGGLAGVSIDLTSVSGCGCGGSTKAGTNFFLSWVNGKIMILSMDREEPALVEAFSAVLEYQPFCNYRSKETNLLTYEWAKVDAPNRLQRLELEGERELQKLL